MDTFIPHLFPIDIPDLVDVRRDSPHLADVYIDTPLADAHDVIPRDADVHRDNLHLDNVHTDDPQIYSKGILVLLKHKHKIGESD